MLKLSDIQRRILCVLGLAAMLALIIVAGVFANKQAGEALCTKLEVNIVNSDSSTFVTRENILQELRRLHIEPVGERMCKINTKYIEQMLNQSEYLENVECVILNNHTLQIQASQLVPVMRIFDGNQSYYVNRRGKRMSATARYHVDVPVVSGHFTADFPPQRMLPLINFVEADETLNSLVTMYSVRDSNNIFIVPCIMGHVVNIGAPRDLENKFAKLREFYAKVMPQKGWLYYDTISVKFRNQVVATRRVKSIATTFDWASVSDDADADIETMTTGDTVKLVNYHNEKTESASQKTSATSPDTKTAKQPEAKQPEAKPTTKQDAANSKVKKAFKQP
ncbi:MAG: cell division protein FtsQ/DivIB [Muribaculaceae bacterium]